MAAPTDPLYAQSWHLDAIGDVVTLWDEITGAGVRIGLYDDGVDYTHAELAANYDAAGHFTHGGTVFDGAPLSGADAHGTALAGVVAARANNGLGGAGVAWDARITSVNWTTDLAFAPQATAQAALDHGASFDVWLLGWETRPLFAGWQSAEGAGTGALLADAIDQAAATGRGGLGSVVVTGAGVAPIPAFGAGAVPALGDGALTARGAIVVGATGADGYTISGSNWGPNLLVAGPAASVTTDRAGDAGYNAAGTGDGDATADLAQTSIFGGSAAAAGVAGGVAALILEAAPGIGWRDVKAVLAESARLTGSAPGAGPEAAEHGGWQIGPGSSWNGGGRLTHPDYGHGAVDAFGAVRMAEAWTTMTGEAGTTATERQATASLPAPVALSDATASTAGVTEVTFTPGGDFHVETVTVSLTLTHSHAPDLSASLIAPSGQEVALLGGLTDPGLMDAGWSWRFSVETLRDLDAGGLWTLRITDSAPLDTGTLDSATLTLSGRGAAADDIHTLTADFPTLAALEPDRARLSDTDGGTDWLNLTALAEDVTVSLNPGGTLTVGGSQWAVMDDANIENAYSGDGNDRLTGNWAANELHAGRGDDTLVGGAGADRLFGGPGADYLLDLGADADLLDGGAGDDQLQGSAGADTYIGGPGIDTVRYNNSDAAVTVDLSTGQASGGHAADDSFASVENLTGSTHNDTLIGDAGPNRIEGYLGDDLLRGGDGADVLYGDLGFDTADFSDSPAGVDVGIYRIGTGGTAQGDRLIYMEAIIGSDFADTLVGGGLPLVRLDGGAGDDLLFDYGGPSILNGGPGNDTMIGRLGADAFDGGPGVDVVRYADAIGAVHADLSTGVGTGADAQGDTYANVENLVGSIFFDTLTGDDGNNRLEGNRGRDILTGRGGTDLLFGGPDKDTFLYDAPSWGNDYIFDFVNDYEQIDISAAGLTFADFTVVDTAFGVRLDYFDGATYSSISLYGLDPADIGPEDFIT